MTEARRATRSEELLFERERQGQAETQPAALVGDEAEIASDGQGSGDLRMEPAAAEFMNDRREMQRPSWARAWSAALDPFE
jgi:hypothetical protein